MDATAPTPGRLSQLLDSWAQGFARPDMARQEPRIPLVPHLAAAADLLLHDAWCSLNLANIPVPWELVLARAAVLCLPSPDDPWPAPDPALRILAPEPQDFLPGEVDPVVLAAIDGYLACQILFKRTVFRMLQDSDPVATLRQDVRDWYHTLMRPWSQAGFLPSLDLRRGRTTNHAAFPLRHQPPDPEAITPCLETLFNRPGLRSRPELAHLGLLWIQPWSQGNGRMARLAHGALALAAGRRWAIIPGDRRATYLTSIQAAFDRGDCEPLARLFNEAKGGGE